MIDEKKQSEAPPADYVMDLTWPKPEKNYKEQMQKNLDYVAKDLLKKRTFYSRERDNKNGDSHFEREQ